MAGEYYNPHLRNPPPPLYGGFACAAPMPPGEGESGIGTARALVWLTGVLNNMGTTDGQIRFGQKHVHGVAAQPSTGKLIKPDVSFVRNGRRINVEIDTNADESKRHERNVVRSTRAFRKGGQQSADRTYFLIIDKTTGQVKGARVYDAKRKRFRTLKKPFDPRQAEMAAFG